MVDKVGHSYLDARNLSLHIAHVGKGELGAVLFIHGFPEIWHSWRHQMNAVAKAGSKAIAPDLCGYGLSTQPSEPEKTTWEDLVVDLLAILNFLSISKVFIVAKDFGARTAYDFALQHPNRVHGVVTLGMPFVSQGMSYNTLPEGFYILRWWEPGQAEADFGRFDVKRLIRTIYILFSRSEIPIAEEGQEIMDLADPSTPLPQWFTEEDLNAYIALYKKSGFQFPLQMLDRTLHGGTGIADPKIEVPVLLIMGEKDYAFKFPGMENYVRSGTLKHFVPDLEINYIPEGSHFVQEQFPDQVNQLVITFLKNHI
ncbi:Putative lysophospholipase [Musa troglodytarum]|uniref:Lysophospholipase n=1 Tax=Musa troglodytarum TaxID=320322 RepID=A0A9E7K1M4_9LILI|nr:Putative lysophospholipase [Musa troglodytarum]